MKPELQAMARPSRDIPAFFGPVRQKARARWDALEADPGLAGPWWQLFRQVQDPRHVISELLQNADDAGATWAAVDLKEDKFWFGHNGNDFTGSDFESLCGFGFSAKRRLHTIGFRGVGFKSTFSLGDRVEVWTPSLAVAFDKKRFTEPVWLESVPASDKTVISVLIDDREKEKAVRESIGAWTSNAVPLLFFRNIQHLDLLGHRIAKSVVGPGPVEQSERVHLTDTSECVVVRIWSQEEEFPPESIKEIREERQDPSFDLPPCRVELVLGGSERSRLFVVLPTSVYPDVPFSCNAPFVQDPARERIKDPSLSPTNRWLLERTGRLAAEAMAGWLGNGVLSMDERALAYSLLPSDPHPEKPPDLNGGCTSILCRAIQLHATARPMLLSSDGIVRTGLECLCVPGTLSDVWDVGVLLDYFGSGHRGVLAPAIEDQYRTRLGTWMWATPVTDDNVLERLSEEPHPPFTEASRLVHLWSYVNACTRIGRRWRGRAALRQLSIVPVRGRDDLCPADEVVVLSEKEKTLGDEQWEFLSQQVSVVDSEWTAYLKKGFAEDAEGNEDPQDESAEARDLLHTLDLDRSVTIETVIERASATAFGRSDPGEDGFRLAQILVQADLAAPANFGFVCRNLKWTPVSHGLFGEASPDVETLLPTEWLASRQVDGAYRARVGRTPQDWDRWAGSAKSRFRRFIYPQMKKHYLPELQGMEEFCVQRGGHPPAALKLKSHNFAADDMDFEEELWTRWEETSRADPSVWVRLARAIAIDWTDEWEAASWIEVRQEGWGRRHLLETGPLVASWLFRLRNKRCLLSREREPHYPPGLLRMNAETAPLDRLEPFVEPDLDQPAYHRFLDLLGVRSTPQDAHKLIDRVRALSKSPDPLVREATNLLEALDRVTLRLPTDQAEEVRVAFREEALAPATDWTWHKAGDVFYGNADEVPGIAVIMPEVAHLTLWERVGVGRQPTAGHAIGWLRGLPSGASLKAKERTRAVGILRRYPSASLAATSHWLSLDGSWQPAESFRWRTSHPDRFRGLYQWEKKGVADCGSIDLAELASSPLTSLATLESAIRFRVTHVQSNSKPATQPDWLRALAEVLSRVVLTGQLNDPKDPGAGPDTVHEAARRLRETVIRQVRKIECSPYLEGSPVGESLSPTVIWNDKELLVLDDCKSHHREIVEEIGRVTQAAHLQDAISYAIGRSPSQIRAFFEEYFELKAEAPEDGGTPEPPPPPVPQPPVPAPIPVPPDTSEGDLTPPVEDAEDEQEGPEDETSPKPRRPRARRPSAQEKVARLFGPMGFEWDPDREMFVGGNKETITREDGDLQWMRCEAGGFSPHRYREVRGSLEDGLELPAEIWDQIKQHPAGFSLLATDEGGELVEVLATYLVAEVREGRVRVYPASYRIRRAEEDA